MALGTGAAVVGGRAQRTAERYVPAGEAAVLVASGAVLIDIRRADELAAIRVPGALNIPAHHIKTKGFLRGKTLLLLDDGHRYAALERTAAELAEAGYDDARIVEGGLAAWAAAGGPLTGIRPPSHLSRIAPTDLAAELRYDHWRLIGIGAVAASPEAPTTTPVSAVPALPAPAAVIPRDRIAELPGVLRRKAAASADRLRPLLLIATADGRDQAAVEALLRGDAPWNVCVLDGGLAAWRAEQRRLQAMVDHRRAAPVRDARCRR